MNEIVILSGKGGAGKTTVTAALCALAENLVAADCDVEAANLKFLLNYLPEDPENKVEEFYGMKRAVIDPEECTNCGKCEEICRFHAIEEIDFSRKVITSSCEGCAACTIVCPEPEAIKMVKHQAGEIYHSKTKLNISLVHASLGIGEENSGLLVAEVRKRSGELVKNQEIDLVLVDGPPGTGCPAASSLTGANFVILVVEASVSGMADFHRIAELIDGFKIPKAVIINRYDINDEATETIRKYCEENDIPLLGKVPHDITCQKALADELPVVLYDKEAPASIALIESWKNLRETLSF
ncbi:MAG: ATP-binding protein [Candidatus Kariarchaeaceae archaeon]